MKETYTRCLVGAGVQAAAHLARAARAKRVCRGLQARAAGAHGMMDARGDMGTMVERQARFVWGDLSEHNLTTALPFRVELTAIGEDKERLTDYAGQLTISALTSRVCLFEGFERETNRLGLWCAAATASWTPRGEARRGRRGQFGPPSAWTDERARARVRGVGRVPNFLPGHYEHGFDDSVCAPNSSHSLYLKGGNDSNFGMTLKLPSPQSEAESDGAPALFPEDELAEGTYAFDGNFRPNAVTFYVRRPPVDADRLGARVVLIRCGQTMPWA